MKTKTSLTNPIYRSDTNSSRSVEPSRKAHSALLNESEGTDLHGSCGHARDAHSPYGRSGIPTGPLNLPEENLAGLDRAWLAEIASRAVWKAMLLGFVAGNCSFAVLMLAGDGEWAGAVLISLFASLFWLLTLRSFSRANRIIAHLEQPLS